MTSAQDFPGTKEQRFAGGGARTHTILRSLDFESSASASSATPAAIKAVRNYKYQPKAQALPIRSESIARKLSGGAKISRRTMASRKPDGDLSNAAISFSFPSGVSFCCVATA